MSDQTLNQVPQANGRIILIGLFAAIAIGGTIALLFPYAGTVDTSLKQSAHIHMAQSANVDGNGVVRPQTTVTPIACTKLPNVPGKSVTTALVEYPPNAFTAAHRHPGSVTAYVTKGIVRSQMQGGASIDYPVGSTWFEEPGSLHLLAENPSTTEPAELLAIFVADDDCGPLVIPEK